MSVDRARAAAAAVSQERLWQRHMAMAAIGAIADHGVNRQALSAEDIRARSLLLEWAGARGYQPAVDPIANLFLRRPGRDADAAPVLAGSHMDSQPAGGRFDGVFGVLAGLEALEALDIAGIVTERPIDLVAWTNEEGGRYPPGCMGSAVFAGAMAFEHCKDLVDSSGVRLGNALASTLAATPGIATRPFGFPIAGYVEPHIEQGPLLERTGNQIGVVTGIQGARWFTVEVTGEPAHAGTAPLGGRKDALRAAVRMIAALEGLMHDRADVLRFTVGKLEVEPNSSNTVPSKVTFTIDFRHPELDVLEQRGDQVERVCQIHAGPCAVTVTQTFHRVPSVFPDSIVDAIECAAEIAGCRHMRLPSGAFHDANFIADLAPAGMIFVPCKDGISHSPAEYAKPEDLAAGARVLAATLVALA